MMERKVIYEGRASIAKYYIGVITYSFFFASVSATGNAVAYVFLGKRTNAQFVIGL